MFRRMKSAGIIFVTVSLLFFSCSNNSSNNNSDKARKNSSSSDSGDVDACKEACTTVRNNCGGFDSTWESSCKTGCDVGSYDPSCMQEMAKKVSDDEVPEGSTQNRECMKLSECY